MENQNSTSALSKLSHLEAENEALRQEISQLRSIHQRSTEKQQKRLAIQQAYQESQHRFKTVFEQSPFGNKIITEDLRIIQVNKALQEMLGYNEEELVGTRVLEYAHPDFISPWRELQKNLWKNNIPSFGIETCLVRKDRSTFYCHVTSILFKDTQGTLGYTILEDITERKRIEEKLQKLYDSQETVIHTVAHDLKNPIHIIHTLSSFVKRDIKAFGEVHTEKKKQSLTHLEMIDEHCEKAYRIIKDLLFIGETELGKGRFDKQSMEMKSFIETQIARFQVEAQEKRITIDFVFPTEAVEAQINEEKMARVLDNLLSNAIKFTQPGGQVTLSLKRESGKVILQVADTGIGIPDKLQSMVFNKFTKANRPGTEGEATTGLGLYIVKQIVDYHGGRIYFESKENEGACFTIELR